MRPVEIGNRGHPFHHGEPRAQSQLHKSVILLKKDTWYISWGWVVHWLPTYRAVSILPKRSGSMLTTRAVSILRVVGQYAYCPASKHTARVSKRAVTYIYIRRGSRISVRGGRQGIDDLIWDGDERFLTYANTDLQLFKMYIAILCLNGVEQPFKGNQCPFFLPLRRRNPRLRRGSLRPRDGRRTQRPPPLPGIAPVYWHGLDVCILAMATPYKVSALMIWVPTGAVSNVMTFNIFEYTKVHIYPLSTMRNASIHKFSVLIRHIITAMIVRCALLIYEYIYLCTRILYLCI